MSTQTITSHTVTSLQPELTKRISVSALLFSAIISITGVLILMYAFNMPEKQTLFRILALLGLGFASFGIYRLIFKSKEEVYATTGSVVRKSSIFFDLKYRETLIEMLAESDSLADKMDFKSDASGNIRMDVVTSKDKKFVALQLFQFVPYAYNQLTDIYCFTGAQAESVSQMLFQVV